VTFISKHLGYDEENRVEIFERKNIVEVFHTFEEAEAQQEYYGEMCDDVYNFSTLWKGRVDEVKIHEEET